MKKLYVIHNSDNLLELDKVAQYYSFIKWLKINYKAYYMLYASHFKLPGNDLKITVSMEYIAPEDKNKIFQIVGSFNETPK